jgi:hypothetical protein
VTKIRPSSYTKKKWRYISNYDGEKKIWRDVEIAFGRAISGKYQENLNILSE